MASYKDIAQLCGVSTATVSYVFNGKGHVSQEIRNRVLKTAEELGYVKKNAEPSRSRLIRLYCADMETLPTHLFFNELLTGILSVTMPAGYDVIVTPTQKEEGERQPVELGSRAPVDGIITFNPTNDGTFLKGIKKTGCPCVVVGRPGGHDGEFCYVDADNVAIGYQMTRHVAANGHTAILMVNGPKELTISQDRLEGYRMALTDSNLPYDPEMVLNCNYTENDVYRVVSAYLETQEAPTAIIANSDIMVAGVVKALADHKIRIPEDCSLICGGESLLVKMNSIPITCVDIHHEELGRRAAEMLLGLIERTLIRVTQYHAPFELNDRGSVVPRGGGNV